MTTAKPGFESGLKSSGLPNELELAEWYWGDISRDLTHELLDGTKDGSYLVRDASFMKGEYILTIRYNSKNKLVRIRNDQKNFGLKEPFQFSSVVELVDYFRDNALKQLDEDLDVNVKLLYPLSKLAYTNALLDELERLSSRYCVRDRYFELLSDLRAKTHDWIVKQKQVLNNFDAAIGIYREQLRISKAREQNLVQFSDLETDELKKSSSRISKRLKDFEHDRDNLREKIELKKHYYEMVYVEILEGQNEHSLLWKQRQRVIMKLEEAKVMWGTYLPKAVPDIINIWDDSKWYAPNLTRQEAHRILQGRRAGSFLVRKSRSEDYALAVTIDGGLVYHCQILNLYTGIGFTEESAYFPNLNALVLYFSMNSLAMYNSLLQTCLKYPACRFKPSECYVGRRHTM